MSVAVSAILSLRCAEYRPSERQSIVVMLCHFCLDMYRRDISGRSASMTCTSYDRLHALSLRCADTCSPSRDLPRLLTMDNVSDRLRLTIEELTTWAMVPSLPSGTSRRSVDSSQSSGSRCRVHDSFPAIERWA